MTAKVRIYAAAASTGRGSWDNSYPNIAKSTEGTPKYGIKPRLGGVILADWETMHAAGYTHRQVTVEHEDIPELVELLMKAYNKGRKVQQDYDAEVKRFAEEKEEANAG
jgi:hypothetical protein